MDDIHFSWVVPSKLAGCRGPMRAEDLSFLKGQGVGAIVRMEVHTISGGAGGLVDLAEYVPDMFPPHQPNWNAYSGLSVTRCSAECR